MELIVQWLLWTLVYILIITELNLYFDYDWRRKGKPRAEKLAHLVAYFGGFFLFLKFVVPLLD